MIMAWLRRKSAETRRDENLRVRLIHAKAGNKWYPHTMADGRVRWYAVARDYVVDM